MSMELCRCWHKSLVQLASSDRNTMLLLLDKLVRARDRTGKFSPDEITRYKDRELLPRLWRTRLHRNYVHYVKGRYLDRFGNPHVGIDIIQYVVEMRTKLYPLLRDEDSSEDNPKFVSLLYLCWLVTLQDKIIHGILFSDLAQIGQIHGIKYKRVLIFEYQIYKLS